jgi:hypothetical protein
MVSSRDLRRVPIYSFCREFAVDGDHFDGGDRGFEALVARLDAGAVERLLQRFAGEHAEGVGDARLLLRLADAARDLVVDGLVVGGFAAEQAAEVMMASQFFGLGQGAGGGGDLPRTGDADDLDVGLPLRCGRSASSAPCSSRSVMTAFQRATTMANFIPAAERSPSMAMGLPGLCVVRVEPAFGDSMNGIEAGDFNQNFGDCGQLTFNKLQVADGREKRRAPAAVELPSATRLEAEKKLDNCSFKPPLPGKRRRRTEGDAFDHASTTE